MARFVSKDKREIGLSPDELIFRGEAKMDEVFLRIIDFDASNLLEEDIKNLEEAFPFQNKVGNSSAKGNQLCALRVQI